MIKVIIFDLWNTLIPITVDHTHWVSLLKKEKLSMDEFIPRYEDAVQLKNYSSFDELRKDFFDEFQEKDNSLLEQTLYEVYFNRYDKIHYFPDVEHILKKLKSEEYKIALLSNMESLNYKEVEEKLHLEKYIDLFAYSFIVGSLKPSKKSFEFVLNHFKIQPSECLVVGDTPRSDIMGAQRVGMHNCLIERKPHFESTNGIKPEFKIKSFEELPQVLAVLNKN